MRARPGDVGGGNDRAVLVPRTDLHHPAQVNYNTLEKSFTF